MQRNTHTLTHTHLQLYLQVSLSQWYEGTIGDLAKIVCCGIDLPVWSVVAVVAFAALVVVAVAAAVCMVILR